MLTTFFAENILIARVIYALLFFIYAFAIVIKLNRRSELKLARSLWLLAVYGFCFGINELLSVITMVKGNTLSPTAETVFWNLDLILRAFAFMVIFWLGVRLIREVYPKTRVMFWTGLVLSMLWTAGALFALSFGSRELYIGIMDNLSRYLFAFPGLLLTGYGLLLHVNEIEHFRIPALVKQVRWLAYTFFCGVFLIGMIATYPVLWPATVFNRVTFEASVGVPLIFFRSIYLVFVTFFVIKIVNVFEVEREYRLEEALKRQVLAEERDRIARELHDGIIQSIYGVGLKLKQFKILCEKRPQDAVKQLDMVKGDLDNIIIDIRDYITDLHIDDYTSVSLREALSQLVDEFKRNAVMSVSFSVQGKQEGELNIVQVNHIVQIVRELLSNALKHSRATSLSIGLEFKDQELFIRISDDGVGFNPDELKAGRQAGESRGLNNIFHRVSMLQGSIVFHSAPGQGTHYEITFPFSKLSYLQSAYMKDRGYFSADGPKEEFT